MQQQFNYTRLQVHTLPRPQNEELFSSRLSSSLIQEHLLVRLTLDEHDGPATASEDR